MRLLEAVMQEIRSCLFLPDATHSKKYAVGYDPFNHSFSEKLPRLRVAGVPAKAATSDFGVRSPEPTWGDQAFPEDAPSPEDKGTRTPQKDDEVDSNEGSASEAEMGLEPDGEFDWLQEKEYLHESGLTADKPEVSALDESDVQDKQDCESDASEIPAGEEDATWWDETDQWDVLHNHHVGETETLWEVGKEVIHQSSHQFQHGAVPIPACVAASNAPSTRASTRNYRTMAIKLPVSCKRCKKLAKEAAKK